MISLVVSTSASNECTRGAVVTKHGEAQFARTSWWCTCTVESPFVSGKWQDETAERVIVAGRTAASVSVIEQGEDLIA